MSTIIVLIIANNYQIYAICVCVYFCYTLSTYFMQEYINVHCFYSSIYLQVYGRVLGSGPGRVLGRTHQNTYTTFHIP